MTIFGVELADHLRGAGGIEMRAPGRDEEHVDVGHRFGMLFREGVSQVAEMADHHAVQLDQVGGVVAPQRSAAFVLVRADAGDEDVVDFVLAGAVDRIELRLDGRQIRVRRLPGRDGHDIGRLLGEGVARLPAHRIGDDDRVLAANAKTVVPIPTDFSHE